MKSRDIDGRLRAIAQSAPQRIALRYGAFALTYSRLLRSIDEMAARFAACNVRRGSPFAVLGENRLEVLLAYYAAARIGAVFVPIIPSVSAREVAHILGHSAAELMLHDEALRPLVADAPSTCRCLSFEELLGIDAVGPAVSGSQADPQADFLIIYTSGSTGAPKAVVFDQAAEIDGNASLIEMWNIGPYDTTLVALPLGFLYGLSTAAATALQAGGEVVLLRKFHPRDVLTALVQQRLSIYHGVPTMFSMMLDYAESSGTDFDLSPVRLLISAGAPLAHELKVRFERRFHKRIDDYYALTEARPVFGRSTHDPAQPPAGSIGKAAPGVRVRVVDERGGLVADGETGELIVRAPATLRRYHRDPELTQRTLSAEGFRTGDLGRCDAQGYYYLTGRIKEVIIHGGAKVAPREVEDVLAGHPAIQMAAVIGAPDRTYGESVVAFVVLRAGEQIAGQHQGAAEALRTFCASRLAEFKVPGAFVFLPAMPLGATGKIDKNALRRSWQERTA
jgi:long-chain acyl-CoA synthetase